MGEGKAPVPGALPWKAIFDQPEVEACPVYRRT